MSYFFTADTHFNHKNIIKYCNLPFNSIKEMDDTIVNNWNSIVSKDDTVYHLGDVAFGGSGVKDLLYSLNGNIILICGSHDKTVLNDNILRQRFIRIYESLTKNFNGKKVFMVHHCHKVWPTSHYGTWQLFGHSHGGLNRYAESEGKLLDVWIGNNNFYPYSLEQITEIMNTRPDNFNLVRK